MIKINLLKSIEVGSMSAGGDGGGNEQRSGLIKLLIILLFPAALYVYQGQVVDEKKKVVRKQQRKLAKLQKEAQNNAGILAEIENLRKEKVMLEERINVIENISRGRLNSIRVLDAIQTLLPQKSWLTKIEIVGENFIVSGQAVSDNEVTELMSSLQQSIFFSAINLRKSVEEKISTGVVKSFEISSVMEDSP